MDIENRRVNVILCNMTSNQGKIKKGSVIWNCEAADEILSDSDLSTDQEEREDDSASSSSGSEGSDAELPEQQVEGIKGRQVFKKDKNLIELLPCGEMNIKVGRGLDQTQH